MKNKLKNQIVGAIKALMHKKKLSQNDWAKQNSDIISASHLSNVLNPDKWDKVSEGIWQALKSRVLSITWEVFETSNFKHIQRACLDAQTACRTVSISAYTGAGKTTALTQYADRTPNCWYLVVRSGYSRRDLISRIAETMGLISGGRTVDLMDSIIAKLTTTKDSLLIIDSISRLNKDSAYQAISDLAEAIEHRAGLVLAGTEFLKQYMVRCCKVNKRGFRELMRRIYAWVVCLDFGHKTVKSEVAQICKEHGITEPQLVAKILADSTNFGELRSAIGRMKTYIQRKA